MPSVVHGGDELTDFPEAPSATENGGTRFPYDIVQYRTIVEEQGTNDEGLEACTQKCFSKLRPLEHSGEARRKLMVVLIRDVVTGE